MPDFAQGRLDFEAFYSLCAEPIIVLDAEAEILSANPAWGEVFGWAPEALKSTQWRDFIHEGDRQDVERCLLGLASPANEQYEKPVEFLCRIRCKSPGHALEEYRWTAWNAARAPNSSHIVARVEEIHEKFEALRLFKLLLDRVPDFVALSKTTGELLYLNPAGLSLVGLSAEQIRGMRHRDFIPETEFARLQREVLPQLQQLGKWIGDSFFRHSDGTILPVHRIIVTLPDERGNPIAYGSIASDLRALEQQESELLRLYALLEHTSDLVAVAAMDRRLQYLNASGSEMLGIPQDQLKDFSLDDIMISLPAEPEISFAGSDAAHDELWNGEHELRAKDGHSIPVSLIFTVLRDDLGWPNGLALVARDLRERKALENALKNSILSLSTPILELGHGILALPVVGAVDPERASQMTNTLLAAIASKRASRIILDFTGVLIPDQASVQHLLSMIRQMMHGASLLGAHCLLSGLSPEIAHAMVSENINSIKNPANTLKTFHTLEGALRFATRGMRA